LAAIISGVIAILCRIGIGGEGTLTGILTIFTSIGIGLFAHFRFNPTTRPPESGRLFLFGLVVHLVMLLDMLTLPSGAGVKIIKTIGLPVMLLYPVATILVGKLLSDQIISTRSMLELQKARQNLSITLNSIGDAVISTDVRGNIVFMNPVAEKLTGWSVADALGRSQKDVFNIICESTRKKIEDPIEKVLKTGTVLGMANHTLLISKSGKERPIADSAAPIKDSSGNISGVVLVFRDQSEQRNLEEQIRQSQKMESLGRLAGGVAHDYNNMLSVILGYTELAMGKLDESSKARKDLVEVVKAAKRSADVTSKLLAFARKQPFSPQIINLNSSVDGMFKMLSHLIGEEIELEWKPGKDLWSVMLDPTQLDQVLANLCLNSRDAISGPGKIIIETCNESVTETYSESNLKSSPGDYVMISVSDDGCGMDKEVLSRLFEPFFTTKKPGQGTGLGMPMVYGIVEQNHGFINVYSEPGEGTVIKIYLPRYKGGSETKLAERSEQISMGKGELILVVEDEEIILTMCKSILENLGYRVLTAMAASEAIRITRENPDIDLLVTDVVMPEMNGKELSLKLLEINEKMRVLFMSGYTSSVMTGRGILGVDSSFIQKPFSMKSFAAKIRESLNKKS
jgi:PAS domain S-box-containing protein